MKKPEMWPPYKAPTTPSDAAISFEDDSDFSVLPEPHSGWIYFTVEGGPFPSGSMGWVKGHPELNPLLYAAIIEPADNEVGLNVLGVSSRVTETGKLGIWWGKLMDEFMKTYIPAKDIKDEIDRKYKLELGTKANTVQGHVGQGNQDLGPW